MQGGYKAVGYSGVVVDQLGQGGKTALRRHVDLMVGRKAAGIGIGETKLITKVGQSPYQETGLNLSVGGRVDPVVVDSPLIAQRDGQLSWAAFAFSD